MQYLECAEIGQTFWTSALGAYTRRLLRECQVFVDVVSRFVREASRFADFARLETFGERCDESYAAEAEIFTLPERNKAALI